MKRLDDLEISILNLGKDYIKSDESTRKLVYQINGKILEYGNTVISRNEANELMEHIINYGKKCEVICSDKIKNKILPLLRFYYRKLENYVKEFKWCEEDITVLQKLVNYNVVNYIKDKKVGLNPDTITRHLQYQKRTYKILNESPYIDNIKLKSFKEMNKELLKEYENIFKL